MKPIFSMRFSIIQYRNGIFFDGPIEFNIHKFFRIMQSNSYYYRTVKAAGGLSESSGVKCVIK